MTDRNDLDEQLYTQFTKCKDFLRQTPVQAESRAHLRGTAGRPRRRQHHLHHHAEVRGVRRGSRARRNIVVMADEAHRGQYGLEEKIDPKTGRVMIGTARIIRDSLPNATYIGFTGTPLTGTAARGRSLATMSVISTT